MRSLITPLLVGGVFLLFPAIGRAHQETPHGITIEQITEPYLQIKSPFWDHDSGKLYISDNYLKRLLCLNIATGQFTYAYIANRTVGALLGPAVPVEGTPDQFIAGIGPDIVIFRWDSDTNCTNAPTQLVGSVDKKTQFNDGKCDSHGRFWAGTEGPTNTSTQIGVTPNEGAVYRLTSDLVIKKEIYPVTASDGIAWNKEYTILYFVDAASFQIVAYDFDAYHGSISNKRLVLDLISQNITGVPDGVAVDTDGNLWVAVYHNAIINVDPVEGKLLRTVRLPTMEVVSVTFGGDSFETLFATSTVNRVAPNEFSGSVYAVKGLGVRGFAGNKFSLNKKLPHARHV